MMTTGKETAENAARTIGLLEEAIRVLGQRLDDEKKARAAFSPAELADAVRFYYQDFRQLSKKDLGAEDAERLYEVLAYVFAEMKKAGVPLK